MSEAPNRFWDPEGKFRAGFLKEFEHWTLELSFRQHTLGCFILFCRRPVEKVSDLRPDELEGLTQAMKKIESVLLDVEPFKPERFNYLQLGNVVNQLHFHGIPRYSQPREFAGRQWIDETYGKPPTWIFEHESEQVIEALKGIIAPHLD